MSGLLINCYGLDQGGVRLLRRGVHGVRDREVPSQYLLHLGDEVSVELGIARSHGTGPGREELLDEDAEVRVAP